MKGNIKRIAVAAAVAIGGGAFVTAADASVDLSPASTPYVGSGVQPFIIDAGDLVFGCSGSEIRGSTAFATTGAVPFRPAFWPCTAWVYGIPVAPTVTMNSDWRLDYVSGSGATSVVADLTFLSPGSGAAFTIGIPAIGCTVSFAPQTGLSQVQLTNTVPTGVVASFAVSGISWTTNVGCLLSAGTGATLSAEFDIPGITVV